MAKWCGEGIASQKVETNYDVTMHAKECFSYHYPQDVRRIVCRQADSIDFVYNLTMQSVMAFRNAILLHSVFV